MVLNIRRGAGVKLDLSRHDITAEGHDWDEFVRDRCIQAFRLRAKKIALEPLASTAYYRLCRLVAYESGFRIRLHDILGSVAIPLITLTSGGEATVQGANEIKSEILSTVPRSVAEIFSKRIFEGWGSDKWLMKEFKLLDWDGSQCVFHDGIGYGIRSSDRVESVEVVQELQEAFVSASYLLASITFLLPGEKKTEPLIQEIWIPKKLGRHVAPEIQSLVKPASVGTKAKSNLSRLRHDFSFYGPRFVNFTSPFDEFFTAGWLYLNLQHPITQALAECIQAISDGQASGNISEHDRGRLVDALQPLFGERLYSWREYLVGAHIAERCEQVRQLLNLTSELKIFELQTALSWRKERLNVPPVSKAGNRGMAIRSLTDVAGVRS